MHFFVLMLLLLLWQFVFHVSSAVTCMTYVSFVTCLCTLGTKLVSPLGINKVFCSQDT